MPHEIYIPTSNGKYRIYDDRTLISFQYPMPQTEDEATSTAIELKRLTTDTVNPNLYDSLGIIKVEGIDGKTYVWHTWCVKGGYEYVEDSEK